MTPERWCQIEEVFHEALELREPARSDFVKAKAGDDDELAVEVNRLLEQYEQASDFIEQPLYDSARDGLLSSLLDETGEDPMIGKVLGSYRIEREIGRGGMGAVYEASRADGEFRLRVAVKVVKRGVDTDFVLRRFRNERQILATLDHPFITRLIDGGSTDDGRPYFVMEYIDGYPLYRYSDKNKLSLSKKLRLFCRVTEAVEYAHQRRVIHRDLKPSNIFITNDGSPRLLDFGIAKLLDPEMAVDTLHPTATALRMMTVDYASPEQVRGETVTYATDIYSLGVILFELLTGYKPYKLASRSSHDVARAICDDLPLVASELVRGSIEGDAVRVNQTATTIAGATDLGIEQSRLADKLKGSLDNIIAKALKKKPEERYASVQEFRHDIERHLRGESISAPAPDLDISLMPQTTRDDPDGKFLAVLPLTLMSPNVRGNTDEAYLTVGLADAIITRLTAVHRLTVRPTSSITRYDEHNINPLRAGRELGVDYVLDGRIRRFGERLRISLQLLDVHSASAIWAGQFDAHLTDVLELEDAISEQVAAALIPQLTGEDRQKLAKRGTNNVAAYEEYMRGRFHWNQFTSHSFPKALEAFTLAVELDPDYALAHVGIADFYIWGNIYGVVTAEETHKHAEAAARRALQIDDQLGEAYASMGLVELNRYAYEKAERLFQRSIELNPHNPLAHEWYSAVLIGTGRFREGLEQMTLAETLDPLSLRTKIMVGWNHCQAGDLRTALQKADEAIILDENYPQAHIQRGYYLCDLGRAEEAVKELEFANIIMPGSSLAEFNLCIAYAMAGQIEDANRVADSMFERSKTEYIKPMFLCFAATAVGRIDEAFHQLEIAVDERDPWLIWLGTDRKLARLRTDPRFTELLHRTRKTFVDGIVTILGNAVQHQTGGGYREAETIPFDEHFTKEFRPGFLRRNLKPIAAAAIVLLGVFGAYMSGFLSVSITTDAPIPGLVTENATRSIAVLPFTNNTNDTGNDYLADGISENLIDRLAMTPAIKVVSRSAVFSFKGKQVDPRDIGRDLGVENIMIGSVASRDGQYVISTELINVSDGIRIFASDFAASADRSFALPAEIAQRIYQSLNVRDEAGTRLQRRSTNNNEAFQLYLKAEFARQKGRPADVENSIRMYQQAAELDPQYALAFQGLALAYRSAPAYAVMPPSEAYPKAQEAARTALSLDPNLSSVHVALAGIKATHDWDFPGAEAEYKRAIALAPNNAEGLYSYGNFLVAMGRTDEALSVYRSAQQVDPLSLNIATNVAWALYIAGRYDEALTQINGVVSRDPSFARAYLNLGEILQEMGRYEEAILAIQKANTLSRDPITEMALGHVYAAAGRRREAENIAADLETRVRGNKLSPFLPAVVHAGLGDRDKAFYWLERAYQERSNWLTLIKVGRRLGKLRGDPRFDDLLQRIGFRD